MSLPLDSSPAPNTSSSATSETPPHSDSTATMSTPSLPLDSSPAPNTCSSTASETLLPSDSTATTSTPSPPLDSSPAPNTRSNTALLGTPRKARPSGGSHNGTPNSTRKIPTCRHCKKLRSGHRRSGCPEMGVAAKPKRDNNRAQSLGSILSGFSGLWHKLKQALVGPSDGDDEDSSGDTETVESQNQEDQGEEQRRRHSSSGGDPSRLEGVIQVAQHLARPSHLRRPGQVMPGTLLTPSFTASDLSQESDGSRASWDHVFLNNQEPTGDNVPTEQDLGTTPMLVNSTPLARDWMEEESNALVGSIAEVDTPAVIITIPKRLAMDAKYAAEREGLFTGQWLISEEEDSFFIMGTDEKEVKRCWVLLQKLEACEETYGHAGLPRRVSMRESRILPKKKRGQVEGGNKKGDGNRRVGGGQLGLMMAGSAALGAAAMFIALAMQLSLNGER